MNKYVMDNKGQAQPNAAPGDKKCISPIENQINCLKTSSQLLTRIPQTGTVVFTLLPSLFSFVPVNGHDMNKKPVEMDFCLTKSRNKLKKTCRLRSSFGSPMLSRLSWTKFWEMLNVYKILYDKPETKLWIGFGVAKFGGRRRRHHH
jgi:hypothetical protein